MVACCSPSRRYHCQVSTLTLERLPESVAALKALIHEGKAVQLTENGKPWPQSYLCSERVRTNAKPVHLGREGVERGFYVIPPFNLS